MLNGDFGRLDLLVTAGGGNRSRAAPWRPAISGSRRRWARNSVWVSAGGPCSLLVGWRLAELGYWLRHRNIRAL